MWEIGTEATQFPEKEYIIGIFVAVRMMVFALIYCVLLTTKINNIKRKTKIWKEI